MKQDKEGEVIKIRRMAASTTPAANNNDLCILYETLQRATSQNPEILKNAEKTLSGWEDKPGFYTALLGIIGNHSFDTNTRFLASIHLKNGIDKHWRKTPNW